MNLYSASRHVARYPSKIVEDEDFRSADQARAFDRDFALGRVVKMCSAPLAAALRRRDDALVKSLRFLADEIDAAPRDDTTASETP